MEVDLENFLIARAVAQDKINHMKTDKQRHTPNRVTLLERIREKMGDRKMLKTNCHTPSESHGLSRKCNKSGEKVVRKIEIGWLHYSKPHYTQVRTRHGGGTRHTTVPKETTVEQVLETGKQLFFPNGSSTKGPQHIFDFEDKFSVEDESDSSTEDLEDLSTGNLNAIVSDPATSDSSTNIPSDRQEEADFIINVDDTASEQSSDLDITDIEDTSPRRVKDSNAVSESDTVEWCSDYEAASEDEVTVQIRCSNVLQSREQQPNAPAHASPDSSVQSIAAISGPTEGFRRASIQVL
ncbi:unnamed protein product [Arctogadus glacialis]